MDSSVCVRMCYFPGRNPLTCTDVQTMGMGIEVNAVGEEDEMRLDAFWRGRDEEGVIKAYQERRKEAASATVGRTSSSEKKRCGKSHKAWIPTPWAQGPAPSTPDTKYWTEPIGGRASLKEETPATATIRGHTAAKVHPRHPKRKYSMHYTT